MLRNSDFQDHDDVQMELHEILKDRRACQQVAWVLWPLYLLGNALLLTMILYIVRWIFDGSNLVIVAGITCTAYACAVIGLAVGQLTRRVSRMEMHALTVHNEVLNAKELIEDDRR
jgi:hypothetical protein